MTCAGPNALVTRLVRYVPSPMIRPTVRENSGLQRCWIRRATASLLQVRGGAVGRVPGLLPRAPRARLTSGQTRRMTCSR